MVLHVVVIYVDGRSLGAHFDMIRVDEGNLSVGNMTKNEGAGNWWRAPFAERPLRFFPQENCFPFYTPNYTCVSNSVPPAEEQLALYNGTIKDRGFPWITGNWRYDSSPIDKIQFWITCPTCVDNTLL